MVYPSMSRHCRRDSQSDMVAGGECRLLLEQASYQYDLARRWQQSIASAGLENVWAFHQK